MKITRLAEPDLYFRGNAGAKDAKTGLLAYGPFWGGGDAAGKRHIRVGAIGTPAGHGLLLNFLAALRNPIQPPQGTDDDPTPFPGARAEGVLGFQFEADREAFLAYPPRFLESLLPLDRKERALRLAEETLAALRRFRDEVHPTPDIVIVALDQRLLDLCSDPQLKSEHIYYAKRGPGEHHKMRPPFFNFHHHIKAEAAYLGLPTQILKARTMCFGDGTEDPHILAWNLTVGLFYKATGVPWKLAQVDENTCYIGFRHYEDFSETGSQLNTSVAQVYMRTGESQVVRGNAFEWEPRKQGRQVYLDRENMADLVRKAVAKYVEAKGSTPRRLVLHKPGPLNDEELEGIEAGAPGIASIDAVHIHQGPKTRAYVDKHLYPVTRGTLLDWGNEATLFATGYVSSLDTYPGPGTPRPIQVVPYRLESDLQSVCTDVLGLTKLDWNTAAFCINEPVTTAVPERVGGVLAEVSSERPPPPSKYLYYM